MKKVSTETKQNHASLSSPAEMPMLAGDTLQTEDLVRYLTQIVFSRPNDAIALACGQNYCIEEMDLSAVAEFKRKDENMEIKFVDRVKALQVLWEILSARDGREEEKTAWQFLQALKEGEKNEEESE